MRLKRCAAQPAATASNTDFNRMAGSTAGRGIPNSSELITGERTAVSNPTFPAEFVGADQGKEIDGQPCYTTLRYKVEKLRKRHIACNEQCGH